MNDVLFSLRVEEFRSMINQGFFAIRLSMCVYSIKMKHEIKIIVRSKTNITWIFILLENF